MNKLLCFIAPSGVGKTTLAEALREDGLKQVYSYTTRPKRSEDEVGHVFVNDEEFKQLDLIAYSFYNGYHYGATKEQVDNADIYVIDVVGLLELKEKYKDRPIIAVGLAKKDYKKQLKKRDKTISRLVVDRAAFRDIEKYCDTIITLTGDLKKDREQILSLI